MSIKTDKKHHNLDFRWFAAKAYLREFYSMVGLENQALLCFFDQAYKKLPPQQSLLELGGGPTIYQLLSARNKVKEVVFTDLATANRREIVRFLEAHPKAFNWDTFIAFTLKLERKTASKANIEQVKNELREKIKMVLPGDVRKKNPLDPVWRSQFDILSLHGVLESSTTEEKELIRNAKNCLSLLKPKGYYMGMFVTGCKEWKCGKQWYPSFPVNEAYIRTLFPKLGLKILDLSFIPAEFAQGYDGLISVLARKSA
ncbi:hypothetical protein A2160_04775 [Candidatus Beckwithbacteria bacterium RBG_13_42_9]|uniref:Methyltransferase domain-containing protein n=1 Tax=Candidatus Beckwithbacteria bacterium RBG_13_42_9 TaxID=1797457 RepID=A0A1F5E600_9BACT|nr:MAG: hypothetical protein A2160_04775 [Candidatus Beckwithbacteria bacterium RBG_13_42_9]